MPFNKTPKSKDEYLVQRIEMLEKQVRMLQNSLKPTVPTYDYTDPPEGVEGQIAIMRNATPLTGGGGGGGLQFDTYPQDGGYLYAHTNDFSDSSIGAGLEFIDDGGGGVYIESHGSGGIRIVTTEPSGTSEIHLTSVNDIYIETVTNGGQIGLTSDGDVNVQANGTTTFRIASGQIFRVMLGSQVLFEVDSNGALHGKTGQSLVFDR